MATGKKKRAAPEAVKEATPVKTAEHVTEKPPIMYVGPTIHKIGVINNTIYSAIPETVEKAIQEKPVLKTLFIPVERYSEVERNIREESGYFWTIYKMALEYLEELKRR